MAMGLLLSSLKTNHGFAIHIFLPSSVSDAVEA